MHTDLKIKRSLPNFNLETDNSNYQTSKFLRNINKN